MKNTISLFCAYSFLAISFLSFNLWSQTDSEVTEIAPISTLRYPTEALFRPSVMPTGIFSVDVNAKLRELKTVGISIGTQFGIIQNLHGEFSYDGVEFNEFVAHKKLNFGVKYNYLNISHVAFSAAAKLPVYIAHKDGFIQDFTLGLPTVFYNNYVAGGILGDVFTLRMRPTVEAEFKFPVWFGAQIYGNLWADVSTSIGEIKLDNPKNQAEWNSTFFWKKLPATLSLLYAFNPYVDMGANFGFDDALKADKVFFGLSLSVRGGKLFG